MSDIIVNKVIKGDETYLDLTNDTVSEGTLLKNRTAHNSEGVQIQGTMEGSGGSVTGVKGDSESVYRDGDVNITAENIGTYTTSQINTLLNGKIDVHGTDSLMTNAEHVKLAGIEAEAEKNVIESISLNGEEITPVNKAVDLSVIDKDVDNLANYYKKSEIDTSLNAKQNIILSSTLSIGGQTIGNVEGALSALNESKSDLVNGKVPVNELPVYTPVIGSIQSIGGIVPPSSSGDEDKYLRSDGRWAKPAGGGGGVTDYDDLTNQPKVNGTTLSGDKTGAQLGLQNIVLSSALSIGGQEITEVEPALRALNEKGGGHTILDEDGTTYPQRSKLQFEGCEITDDAVNGITVVKCEGGGVKKYAKPTITVGTYTYDGTTQAPTITGFDANVMTLTGTYEAINAGSYTFTIALSDKTSSKWTDDTQDDIVTSWSISKVNSNTTASTSSVSLNTSNTSRTVTLSNVTGTVTVSSSNTSVATASVSNNTVTISGVNHKDGSATITISIAASTNYKAKTLTVSVSASYKSTITVTLYSAASDTVSFTDDAGNKTVVTDTSGKKTGVSIVIPYNGKTITFTSSVAKNPSNLSNAYSKSIALTRSTTEIKVMPDGALYWWGTFTELSGDSSFSETWSTYYMNSYNMPHIEPTWGTNSFTTSNDSSQRYCGYGSDKKVNITNYNYLKAYVSGFTNNDSYYRILQANPDKSGATRLDGGYLPAPIVGIEPPVGIKILDISAYSGNYALACYSYHARGMTVSAIWLE